MILSKKRILKSIVFLLPSPIKNTLISLAKQLRNFQVLWINYAQFRSIQRWQCSDREGNPIPWYTYPAIEYLQHLNLSELKVFEFGSGNSTLFWSRNAQIVSSVEDDILWYEKIKKESELNKLQFEYIFASNPNEYVQSLFANDFVPNIIIIDGKNRTLCAEAVFNYAKKNIEVSMIIFDNSDWYPKTIDILRKNLQWVEVDFHGFGPINHYTWTTTFFINPNSRLLTYSKPLMSIASLPNNSEV